MSLRSSVELRGDTARRDYATKALHNTSILLLKLPQEIKNHIYTYVCGGQLLYVHRHHDSKSPKHFCHHLCEPRLPTANIQEPSTSATMHENSHHEVCCARGRLLSTCHAHHHESPQKIDLSFLRNVLSSTKKPEGLFTHPISSHSTASMSSKTS